MEQLGIDLNYNLIALTLIKTRWETRIIQEFSFELTKESTQEYKFYQI